MIQRFKVKSFKSLHEVDIELGRINVFVGANGSGKSNLLEALGVLGAAAGGRVDDESLLRRGVRPGVPALYKSSFKGTRIRAAIRLEVQARDSDYAVELNNPIRDPSPAWQYKSELLKAHGTSIVGRSPSSSDRPMLNPEGGIAALKRVELTEENPASSLLADLQEYCIYTPSTSVLRGLIPDSQQRDPVGLSGGRLPEAVRELLASRNDLFRKVSTEARNTIDWVRSFGVSSVGSVPLSPSAARTNSVLSFRDRFMADGRDLLTGYDASEGALYLLFAAVLAVHPRAPHVLAIDNADHGLNPRLARTMMELICSWVIEGPAHKQMLMTVHNPLALDGLPIQDDNVRLFAVDRSNKGRTVIHRVVPDSTLLAKAQDGWTLSRLWVMGHLGGVPNV